MQILHALSERSCEETIASITDRDSETGKTYRALKATFDHARRIFSDTSAILLPDELDIKELGDQETIQIANMATICASVLEAGDVPLLEAHDHFLMAFLPESGAMSEELSRLFLRLKMQTCVSELSQEQQEQDEDSRAKFVERIFPEDLEEQLKLLHSESALSEHELVFLTQARASKSSLLSDLTSDDTRRMILPQDA